MLRQVKLVKAEVQMLRGDERARCVRKLRDAGFVIYAGGLQFAVPKLDPVFREKIVALGVRIGLVTGVPNDPQTIVIGDWAEDRPLPFDDLDLTSEFKALLAEAKAQYFQIDLVALNRAHAASWNAIAPSLKL